MELQDGLREYAVTSALKDSRFSPVPHNELSNLQVSVSLLCNFEDGEDWENWQLGTQSHINKLKTTATRCFQFLPTDLVFEHLF